MFASWLKLHKRLLLWLQKAIAWLIQVQIMDWCRKRTTSFQENALTHWGGVPQICVSKLNIIGSDNALSPNRCQTIIWTNAEILLIEPSVTNFSEISIELHIFSFGKMHFKMSSGKWRPFCLGLNAVSVVFKIAVIFCSGFNVLNKLCWRELGKSATWNSFGLWSDLDLTI